jgi:putative copper resistance protein D
VSPFWLAIPEWIELVSLACCTGVLVCSLWVVSSAPGDAPSGREDLLAEMRRLLGIAAAALLASSIPDLVVRSAEMSGNPISRVLPVLPTVLLRTHVGHTWLLRTAAILGLSVMITAARGSLRSRPLQHVLLGFVVVVAAMDSASGHASDAGDFSAAEIVDGLHLLAALVWGGGLLVLSLVILPRLLEQGDRAAGAMAGVATRFSGIAGVGIAVIALTAVYQARAYGGSIGGLARSPFGRTIIAKIVLFSLLLVLGAFNRYVSVPRLQEWAGSSPTRRGALGRVFAPALRLLARDARGPLAATRFACAVRLETFLLVAVLGCAALLRHEAPARHEAHPEHHPVAACGAPRAAPRPG